MEKKTYYGILGVSSTESDKGIRAAYRDLAKKLHPDVAGEAATRSFQEVSEAYSVLSDPRRRSEYNHKLNRAGDGDIVRRSSPEPLMREPVTMHGNRADLYSLFEVMHDRFLRNFTRVGVPAWEQLESLNFEVFLTREEASRGCVVPVGVPVFTRCAQCRGSGVDGPFACASCHRQGMIENEKRLHIRIPPMCPSGSIYEISLQSLGIHNLYLRLQVFVEAPPR
jgi:molecular chaperone DnaJ